MKMKETTQLLESMGWSIYVDEVGDKVAHFVLDDRIVDIIYGIKKFSQDEQYEAIISTSTSKFSEACMEIRGRGGSYTPLASAKKGLQIRAQEILEDHVRQASDDAIEWARAQDLKSALQEYAELPTSAPGARPVWHLAALAVLGDIERLRFYQKCFEAGDNCGFVPFITKDYIDRALSLAQRFSSSS